MKKRITIIIVTYNSDFHIYDCLESIYKHNDIDEELEIIVVDNNSTNVDFTFQQIIERFGSKIILIKNNKNGGYGQGNNIGVKYASAEIIMILNPDVRLVEPIFKSVILSFEKVNVVMVGLQQNYTIEKRGLSFLFIDNSITGVFEGKLYNLLNLYVQKKMCISGSCFFIRKSSFLEVGMFDENIFMYGEELDLHNRLLQKNESAVILYDKSIKYLHLVSEREHSLSSEIRQFDSFVYLTIKNGSDIRKECLKRIRLYRFLRLKTLFFGGDVLVFERAIQLFKNYLNTNNG